MWFTIFIEQDVPWFDVSMQNAVFMCVMNCARHFGNKFHRAPDRQRHTSHYFVKLAAFDEVHAEVALTIALAHLVDGDDARMLQACSGFRFSAKTLQMRFGRPGA